MICVGVFTVSQGSTEPTLVNTSSGVVRGSLDGGARTFLGIPYAAAERWQPPKPPAKWDGVRNATKAGLSCEVPPQGPCRTVRAAAYPLLTCP